MSPGYRFNIRSEGHKSAKHTSVEGDRVASMSLQSIKWPLCSL